MCTDGTYSPDVADTVAVAVTAAVNVSVASIWFLFSSLFNHQIERMAKHFSFDEPTTK